MFIIKAFKIASQIRIVDMSDLTGQSMLNEICLGGCGNERRTTLSAKTWMAVKEKPSNSSCRLATVYEVRKMAGVNFNNDKLGQ